MATTEGKKRASVWGRSAPALPFGQSACGGHGLRSTPPNAAGPGAAPGLLTRNTAPATLSLQAGPVRLHYYILNCPGDCRKMGVSSDSHSHSPQILVPNKNLSNLDIPGVDFSLEPGGGPIKGSFEITTGALAKDSTTLHALTSEIRIMGGADVYAKIGVSRPTY